MAVSNAFRSMVKMRPLNARGPLGGALRRRLSKRRVAELRQPAWQRLRRRFARPSDVWRLNGRSGLGDGGERRVRFAALAAMCLDPNLDRKRRPPC